MKILGLWCGVCGTFFFLKQKTAYGLRMSDWSSDVCSSVLQGIIAVRLGAGPAPGFGLRLRIGQLVTDLGARVAPQLARDGRRLAIQSCSDLPDRLPVFMKTGNRTALLKR